MSVERSELNVERSAPRGAVFLSYASQDTEAAKRIADALRAAGVEVWFDQSELVGGDAWDAKIRRQISTCGLFVPIISAATQARGEGYFRLEWKLAVDRSHLMASDQAFLLPVVIDPTPDAAARVPAEFKTVQWTKLPGGETPPAFAARVKKLLSGEQGAGSTELEAGRPRSVPGTSPRPAGFTKWWWALPVLGLVLAGGLMLTRPTKGGAPGPAPKAASEVSRVRASLRPDEWTRADFDAFIPVTDRLIQANPEDGEAWALRSIANSLLVIRNLDTGTKPLQIGREAADRALRLAPDSSLAELSLGMHFTAMISRGGDVRAAGPHIQRGLAGAPLDTLARYAELTSYWLGYQFEGTDQGIKAWLAAEPAASFPAWIQAQSYLARRRSTEAAQWAERAAADPDITGVRSLVTLFETRYYLQADLPAARAAVDRVATGQRNVHRVVVSRFLLAMAEQHYDQALQELSRTPGAMLLDRVYHGPKAVLAAMAHAAAGRGDVAQVQFREAEQVLREELAHDADNQELRAVLAFTLASLGRDKEARLELTAVAPLLNGQSLSVYSGQVLALLAQTHGVLGEIDQMVRDVRRLLTEPSTLPFTPASLRLDCRFARYVAEPAMKALLVEFAGLDQPKLEVAAKADDKSVAVLAFANLSDDKGNEYFSDGISEELLNVLAKVPKLKVAARTSSFYFKGKEVPVPEIAQKLGVAYVVEGSVRKSGNKVRITAQLIKAVDGFHVWSETYDRELKDIFAVQDEIAKNILAVVKGSLLGEADLPHATTTKIEAYTLFLQAQGAFAKRGDANLREAIRLFEAALAIDPDYVPALVGLAQARVLVPIYANLSGAKAREMIDAATKAARHALELDPRNATAHAVIGSAMFQFEWRWSEGVEVVLRARDLAPNDAWIWNSLGDYYRFVGDFPQALAAKQREWELDPLSPVSHWDLAYTYMVAGNYDQTIHWAELTAALAPHNLDSYMPAILAAGQAGRVAVMRQTIAAARRNVHENEGMLLLLEAKAAIVEKKPEEARRILAVVTPLAESGDASPAYLGYCHLLLGDSGQAALWLRRAVDQHDGALVWTELIDFDVIAANPATRPILDRPGLKELYELRQRNARAGANKL